MNANKSKRETTKLTTKRNGTGRNGTEREKKVRSKTTTNEHVKEFNQNSERMQTNSKHKIKHH